MIAQSIQTLPIVSGTRASADRPAVGDRYLTFLCVCLLGYALLGKLFAYVGVPPAVHR